MLIGNHHSFLFQRVKSVYGASLQQTIFKVLWNLKLVCFIQNVANHMMLNCKSIFFIKSRVFLFRANSKCSLIAEKDPTNVSTAKWRAHLPKLIPWLSAITLSLFTKLNENCNCTVLRGQIVTDCSPVSSDKQNIF